MPALAGAALVLGIVGGAILLRGETLDTRGARVVRETIHSDMLDRDLEQIIVLPEGFQEGDHRPLLVVLHGRSDSPAGRLNNPLMEALSAAGDDAPVVLLANGGDSSYYHDRDDGPWGSYLDDELIPYALDRFSLDPDRVVYGGISMGGYGALELVRQSGEQQCGVAAIAPALWHSAGQTPSGAFDDAEDFEAHDVLGAVEADPTALHGTPVYLAVGEDDPFHGVTASFAKALREGPSPVVHRTGAGGHTSDYWDARMADVLAWTVDRLATC